MKVEPFNPATQVCSNWLHRFALLTAGATLPLLFIGGLVTSTGAGLAVPDWPTTFGYNMFFYPWSKMVGGVFYEHAHRLVASAVGLLTLLLALLLWFSEKRRWLRWLGIAALAFVILQGVIGGLRVVLLQETLAILHACFAQAFFALAVSLAVFTSREWQIDVPKIELTDAGRIQRLSFLTTGLIYFQSIFGAVLRHTGAGLEMHLIFAALVALHVFLLAGRILKFHSDLLKLARPAMVLVALFILQSALGLGAYVGKFTPLGTHLPAVGMVLLPTSHVVTGALMLMTSLLLTLRSYRMLQPDRSACNSGFLSERTSI